MTTQSKRTSSRLDRALPKAQVKSSPPKPKQTNTLVQKFQQRHQTNSTTRLHKENYHSSWVQARHFLVPEVSVSERDSNEEEEESDSEIGELIHLSSENIVFHSSDDIRNLSYDSRCESGNKNYELDDFVAIDDYESDENEDQRGNENVPIEKRRRLIRKGKEVRKMPADSDQSSKLFFSEPDNEIIVIPRRTSAVITPSPTTEGVAEVLVSEAPEEIVEHIMDGVRIFSRRCNRDRPSIMLLLSTGVLEDLIVIEALQHAVRLGLGKMLPSDGTEMWTIGPRGR